jgi:hypothetical protein
MLALHLVSLHAWRSCHHCDKAYARIWVIPNCYIVLLVSFLVVKDQVVNLSIHWCRNFNWGKHFHLFHCQILVCGLWCWVIFNVEFCSCRKKVMESRWFVKHKWQWWEGFYNDEVKKTTMLLRRVGFWRAKLSFMWSFFGILFWELQAKDVSLRQSRTQSKTC